MEPGLHAAGIEYKEVQKFAQLWILLPISISAIIVLSIFGYGVYRQIIMKIPFGSNPMPDEVLLIVSISILLIFTSLITLFYFTGLELTINRYGIQFRFFPFHLKERFIGWDSVDQCEIISYKPIKEFGGWGIKFSGSKILYSVSGSMGLYIKKKEGKSIILGISDLNRLIEFIKNAGLDINNKIYK